MVAAFSFNAILPKSYALVCKQGREKHCQVAACLATTERRGRQRESERERKPPRPRVYTLPCVVVGFYVKPDFDVCESGPMAGAGCGAEGAETGAAE